MAFEEFVGGRFGNMQPGVYKDGVKQDSQQMVDQSGFIGRNNMGMQQGGMVGTPPPTQLPPVAPKPMMNAKLLGKPEPQVYQNVQNWLTAQQGGAPKPMMSNGINRGSMFSDNTGSLRII